MAEIVGACKFVDGRLEGEAVGLRVSILDQCALDDMDQADRARKIMKLAGSAQTMQ